MSPEEHYVRNATRGLRGKERQETQTELLSHLHERTQQLILGGLDASQAQQRALQEIGPAPTVARTLRQEQGFTTASQLALGTLVSLTLLASLTARLYAQDNKLVTDVIDHRLFPDNWGWQDPCKDHTHCAALYSDAPLTTQDTRQAGFIRMNEANTYLQGSGLSVRGLLRKSLTLESAPSIPVQPFSVGRDGKSGLQNGYLNLPRAMIDGAQVGWPIQLRNDGRSMQLQVDGHSVGQADYLALNVTQTYLSDLLDRHLTADVRAAASIEPENDWWQPQAWAFPSASRTTMIPKLSLRVPNPKSLYALISFIPEHRTPHWTIKAALRAVQIPATSGTLNYPMVDLQETSGQPVQLVNTREHFLSAVKSGQNVAMLIEVPRDLRLPETLNAVQQPERTVNAE
ncbi:permease prefix domain 1-containing protein [Deinococcus aquaticus]|uniref:permease prefix domain 1-containing protein n=1 Tax=Deinococcus aquaticus TaxID=328692 RepID=UPI003F44E635